MLRFARTAISTGAAVAMGAIALGGCVLLGSNRHDEAQRELNQNRRLWEAQGFDDYRFVARRSCFCGQEVTAPVIVEVRGDQIVSLTYQETGEPVAETYAGLWPSLDRVFDIVQDAIDRDSHQVIVEYDRERGFPTVISLDYIEQAIDDELVFYAGSFELLPEALSRHPAGLFSPEDAEKRRIRREGASRWLLSALSFAYFASTR